MLVFNIKYVGFRSSDFSTSLRPDLSEAPFVKQSVTKKREQRTEIVAQITLIDLNFHLNFINIDNLVNQFFDEFRFTHIHCAQTFSFHIKLTKDRNYSCRMF